MKKIIAIFIAALLIMSFGTTAFAAEFVPSVSEKDAPVVVAPEDIQEEGTAALIVNLDYEVIKEIPGTKLIVTGIGNADKSTEIPEEARVTLKKVSAELAKADVKLSEVIPAMNDLVKEKLGADKNADNLIIRDLFDVSLVCEETNELLIDEAHRLVIKFDIGIAKDKFITAMKYNMEAECWETIYNVTNNGDGTITCEFDHLCPIAFLVEGNPEAAQTGDNSVSLYIWIALAAVSAGLIVVLFVTKNKKEKEAE